MKDHHMYHSPIVPAAKLAGISALDGITAQTPFAVTPVIHPQHGLPSPDSKTFWSATANALYIVRQDGEDLFGSTPGFANKLVACPDLVAHGRRGPIGCDAAAIAGTALWQAADEAAIRDRPSAPVAWHGVGWLPMTTDETGWHELVLEFLDAHVVAGGMVADWAIHALADGNGGWIKKPHFHTVLTSRFWKDGPRKGQPQPAWLTTVKRQKALADAWANLRLRAG